MSEQLNYQKRLSQSQSEKDSKQVKFKVDKAKLSLEASILGTQETIAEKEIELDSAKSEYPLNFEKIASLVVEMRAAREGLELLQELKGELFPTS